MHRAALVAASLLLWSADALAADSCPPGSYPKSENGYDWCQPTVCVDDAQCDPGQVCRPYSLCMKVGELAEAGAKVDGGDRLMVMQACGPDKRCPQLQTCSTMGRCFAPAVADRLGLTAPKPAATPADEPKKSACGCRAVGSSADGGLALVGFGIAIIAQRARARRRARSPQSR